MTGKPTFRVIECGSIPDNVIEFRNSVGYALCKYSLLVVSADRYVLPSPGNFSMIASLILFIFSLIGVSIAHLETKYLSEKPISIPGILCI